MATFKKRLKELRTSMKFKQKEVGAWINVSESSIRKYEAEDNRTPNPEAIKILANRFGVTTDYLLGNDDRSIAPNVSCLFEKPEIIFDGETYQLNEDDRKKIRAALQLALYDAKKRKEHKKITDNQ